MARQSAGEPPETTADAPGMTLAELVPLIEKLGAALPPTTEVILHDFSQMSASVVAVGGDVTGRRLGDPPTDVLLSHVASGAPGDLYYYDTYLPDGRKLTSSTIIVRSRTGEALGAVCVNNDLTAWQRIQEIAELATHREGRTMGRPAPAVSFDSGPGGTAAEGKGVNEAPASSVGASGEAGEHFAHSIGELANTMVARSIADVGLPVELMRKEHKLRVVADLQSKGIFQLRESVDEIAAALQVSRFTIYNYLNQSAAEKQDPAADA